MKIQNAKMILGNDDKLLKKMKMKREIRVSGEKREGEEAKCTIAGVVNKVIFSLEGFI